VNGELVAMSLGTGRHGRIIKFIDDGLNAEIQRSRLDWTSQRLTVGV
jgi:Uma2 family endonuclease